MTKFKFIICCIASSLLLNGCDQILEPVSLIGGKQDDISKSQQEEFEINIKSLTFKTAVKANNAPYPRRMVLTGSGYRANVLNEANFLKSNFPKSSSSPHYLLGIGDQISLTQLNEFVTEPVQWPSNSNQPEYILGIGDELAFAQSNDGNQNVSIAFSDEGELVPEKGNDILITTKGVIGSNGNILLYGLGNILAANRTLESVRTEVRNILIRNGLAPNFQLDISTFQSKKAYINVSDGRMSDVRSKIITLNNLPITLKELALTQGLSLTDRNLATVTLTRNEQEFRFTAGQLFNHTTPEITIQDNDQIEIQIISNEATAIQSIVGSKGNILSLIHI